MSAKNNPERVRGKYANAEIVIVGAVDKPIEQTDILPQLIRRRSHTNPPPLVVRVDDDLRTHFPDAASVNEALRSLASKMEQGDPPRRSS